MGNGVEGVNDNVVYRIGKFDFMHPCPELANVIDKSQIFLQKGNQLMASFKLEDSLRDDAIEMINNLKLAGVRNERIIILSGDDKTNVEHIGHQLGLQNLIWRQNPEQKLAFIKDCQVKGERVLMVGDGINDAPVLALSNVSIAMGDAADMSKRSADIVMLTPKLTNLMQLFKMATKTRRKIKQNMAWAIGYNILILPLAVAGYLTPWMAVIGMSLSSIIVVSNSVRLLK